MKKFILGALAGFAFSYAVSAANLIRNLHHNDHSFSEWVAANQAFLEARERRNARDSKRPESASLAEDELRGL